MWKEQTNKVKGKGEGHVTATCLRLFKNQQFYAVQKYHIMLDNLLTAFSISL
jgi:hypothetical protein